MTSAIPPGLIQRLRDRLAMATQGKWEVQEGCSWRRIGTAGRDGNVLHPTVSRHDGHPDLSSEGGDLYANLTLIVEAVNALPALLDALAAAPSPPVMMRRETAEAIARIEDALDNIPAYAALIADDVRLLLAAYRGADQGRGG